MSNPKTVIAYAWESDETKDLGKNPVTELQLAIRVPNKQFAKINLKRQAE